MLVAGEAGVAVVAAGGAVDSKPFRFFLRVQTGVVFRLRDRFFVLLLHDHGMSSVTPELLSVLEDGRKSNLGSFSSNAWLLLAAICDLVRWIEAAAWKPIIDRNIPMPYLVDVRTPAAPFSPRIGQVHLSTRYMHMHLAQYELH